MSYSITWLENGVYLKASGIFTLKENLTANGELYGNARFGDLKFQIADFLEADLSEFNSKSVNIVGKMESISTVWNNKMKIAHICKDQKTIELIKVYEESLSESNWEFGIFDNYDAAFKWASS